MLHTTRWRPDTCGCDLEYEWDDTTPLENRPCTYKTILKTCPQHTGLSASALYAAVLGENQRKNTAHWYLISDSNLGELFTDSSGNQTYRFKAGITLSWYWVGTDSTRVLHLVLAGISLTPSQRNKIGTWLDNTFGTGKVVLD